MSQLRALQAVRLDKRTAVCLPDLWTGGAHGSCLPILYPVCPSSRRLSSCPELLWLGWPWDTCDRCLWWWPHFWCLSYPCLLLIYRAYKSIVHSFFFCILYLLFRASWYSITNNQQMQLYAVNFIPLLSSLYMFRAAHTPIIWSAKFNCIYSHWYNHRLA